MGEGGLMVVLGVDFLGRVLTVGFWREELILGIDPEDPGLRSVPFPVLSFFLTYCQPSSFCVTSVSCTSFLLGKILAKWSYLLSLQETLWGCRPKMLGNLRL